MSDTNPQDEKPKDRNEALRARLLKKRFEQEQKQAPLTTSELIDDAFTRSVDAAVKWLKKNASTVGWVALAGVVGGIGYLVWDSYQTKTALAASVGLGKALRNQRGYVAETPPPPELKDPTPTFKTREERTAATLEAYRKVASEYGSTGAGMLAKLGEAGALLDKHDWDGALAAYRAVKDSPLGKADVDVRARALEGIGFAHEGKGELDEALKAFQELENTGVRGLKETGMYHQARILLSKGEKEKAKTIALSVRESLQKPSESQPFSYLEVAVGDLLRKIDPSMAPDRVNVGRRPISEEDLRRLQEEFQRRLEEAKQKAQEHGHGIGVDDHPEPIPVQAAPAPAEPQGESETP